VHGLGETAEALDEKTLEAEELDLLGGLDAGAEIAHVVELPPLGRAEIVEAVAEGVELQFAEQRRQQRDEHQQDQRGPVGGERDHQRDGAEYVLDLAEDEAEQAGATRDLPPGAVEPVLLLAALELLEIERGRLLHQ